MSDEDDFMDIYRAEEEMQSDPSSDGVHHQGATISGMQESQLRNYLTDLGLHCEDKLSLRTVLQINKKNVSDQHPTCVSDLPCYLLRKLMSVNVTARNVKFTNSPSEAAQDSATLDWDQLLDGVHLDCKENPLDIITALLLCSDSFVQQEILLKMSMCQFAVPLLLPSIDSNQSTLLLWAMRDIVHKYRPQSLSESKGFVEEQTVLAKLPLVSFVRLGKCSLSKSEILNKVLCNSQQYHDIFVHHNMECGNIPRKISSGMVEMTWYLPCGNKDMDHFNVPVSVTNLRGDVQSFDAQYSFLCKISTAVFVFCDDLALGSQVLTKQHHRAEMFLVSNSQSGCFNVEHLKQVTSKLELNSKNIVLKKPRNNEADFLRCLRDAINYAVDASDIRMSIEGMTDAAHELGILVDEDLPACQGAKKSADAITKEIVDPLIYKELNLPRQGEIWKKLTDLEKEQFRLRKAGNQSIEMYKSQLETEKKHFRRLQQSWEISSSMQRFIEAISTPGLEREFFLKWMKINLDNLSREKLSKLREQYRDECDSSKDREEIQKIDKQLSSSSLGMEHFFREMGQIYEASLATNATNPLCQDLQHLPKLCAELMLKGLPLELVDGDASNTPLMWTRDVLLQLNALVAPEARIKVITVLGVQSTGKSTLLNTMFGVQFAVSSGRCTRGAFMLLIKVGEDVKQMLNCDYVVIIDTEGLKSPQLAQLEESYDHDNELATLVVGLSDITIINISMEHMQEMEDVLQIVVHAFLRMKEVGKKPKCLFVHQNVSDVSAHDTNMRDRKVLLQKLNRMTQEAAKMEKREENKLFTDVMEYNPDTGNWYIPGLWNGTPPMAPVNLGYSVAVNDLKNQTIHKLSDCNSSENNIKAFTEWLTSLWSAVKHENFIFSFRNSLVADAYNKLCTAFNKWEWEFKKAMYTWTSKAETKISNLSGDSNTADMASLLDSLKREVEKELSHWEHTLLDKLTQYFDDADGSAHLIERYREQFANSAKSLRMEIKNSVKIQLERASETKRGMIEFNRIKKTHTDELEGRVCDLIDKCRKTKTKMTDPQLNHEFEEMWKETEYKLSFPEQKALDVFASIDKHLWENVNRKGAKASQLLHDKNLRDCGLEPFTFNPDTLTYITDTVRKLFNKKSHIKEVQGMADSIIAECKKFAQDKIDKKCNYHETCIKEILDLIDNQLKAKQQNLKTDIQFEILLKQHICGTVARDFQKMHIKFIELNDPYRWLAENKEKFLADFKDVFHERDQCQRKADEFTSKCLKPAITDFVYRSLGLNIVDKMLTQEEFSTRMSFQYSLLKDLLYKMDFQEYLEYICSYEEYAKRCVHKKMVSYFSVSNEMLDFEDRHIRSSISSINKAIEQGKTKMGGNLRGYIEYIYKALGDKLIIPQTARVDFMIFNKAAPKQFAFFLTKSLEDMSKTLKEEFQKETFETKLKKLTLNPEDELFSKVIGCGKQCPFCSSPCEAGSRAHDEHWASVHRPSGLGKYRFFDSDQLVTDICSSLVISDTNFRCLDTNGQWHPYKTYREIYPDWKISPDVSLIPSDYWKYVMMMFNEGFAEKYECKPAEIPETWKGITPKQAGDSLKQSFNIH